MNFIFLIPLVWAHTISVYPGTRECFHEELHKDDRMSVNFQNNLGGDMLINFWITDSNNNVLVNQPQVSMGDHSIDAKSDGRHSYCFMHEGRDSATREVSFNVHGVVYVSEDDPEHQDPLERQIRELNELVAQVKDELEYIVIREQVHRDTSESTNARVKWWSIGETILLVAVCLFQVVYLSMCKTQRSTNGRTIL